MSRAGRGYLIIAVKVYTGDEGAELVAQSQRRVVSYRRSCRALKPPMLTSEGSQAKSDEEREQEMAPVDHAMAEMVQLALGTTGRLLHALGLPASLLDRVQFSGSDPLPSTLHLGEFAQALIATTALAASHLHDLRNGTSPNARVEPGPRVHVRCDDAVAEFRSEHVATLDGEKLFEWDELAGAYQARGPPDAWIRPHTNWEHHKRGFLDLLGLPAAHATKQKVAAAVRLREADELAEQAMRRGLVCTALRSYAEWCACFPPCFPSTSEVLQPTLAELYSML